MKIEGRRSSIACIVTMCALVCTSCSVLAPRASATIAPATFTDLWLALVVDFQNLLSMFGL